MAVKVSDLTTESAPASTDILLIADPTTGIARKITVLALKSYMDGLGGGGDVTAPTVVSAVASSSNQVVITFSENVTVTTAGWSFKQNGSSWTASSVSGSGNIWTFTMSSGAIGSDTLLYSYSAAGGVTVDTASNELANITDASITNSISGTAPTVSSKIVSTPADDIVVVFSQSMTSVTTAGWSAKKNGAAWTISSVSGSGTTWTFQMASSAISTDTLVISYDSTTGATIGTSLELGSFTDSSVTNSVFAGTYLTWLNLGTLIEQYNSSQGIRKTTGGASEWTPASSDSASNQTISTTERVVFTIPDINDICHIGLQNSQTLSDLGSKTFGIVLNSALSGDIQGYESNTAVGSLQNVVNGDYACVFYDGATVKYQVSSDGISWTTFHTSAVTPSGSYYVHVQCYDALSGPDRIYKI
jgi:hypothetical protein